MGKRSFYIFILILLSLPAVWSLFHPGFFPSHDGEWMVIRLSDFHRSFVSGQIPVRWAARLNHGYGYPVFNFLYPFSLYLGEFFYFFTGSFVNSVKGVFILSFWLSGVFMYLWIGSLWGDLAGLASAVLYIYTPYRFLDVYVRGSLGEAVAFIFPPLIFWSADKLAEKRSKLYFLVGGFAFSGLITAHNTMAMLFTILFLGYLGFRWLIFRQKEVFFRQASILLLGLGLSAFFWLPALYDRQYILFGQVMVSDFFAHFPTLRQLIIPSWGYGPSLPFSNKDTPSFQIGLLNLTVFAAMVLVFGFRLYKEFSSGDKRRPCRPPRIVEEVLKKDLRVFYFLFIFAASSFLMLGVSGWVWRLFSVYNLIQFPWRLLSLTTFSSAILTGGLVQSFKDTSFAPFPKTTSDGGPTCPPKPTASDTGRREGLLRGEVYSLVILLIFLNCRYARPEYFVDRGEDFYATNEATTTVQNEYMPIWVEEPPVVRAEEKVEIISGQGKIKDLTFNSKRVNFNLEAETETEIQINTIYFPGWEVELDGQPTLIRYRNEVGLMRFAVGSGEHRVVAEFGETPLRLFADVVSLASLVIIGGLSIRWKRVVITRGVNREPP